MLALSRRWLRRGSLYVLTPVILTIVAGVLALRLWILPNLDYWRNDIASSISQSAGQKITLGQLTADWQGWHPQLRIQQLRVYGQNNRPALILSDVHTTLSWKSLLHGELRLGSLIIDDLVLSLHRTADGTIYVAGMPIRDDKGDSQFSNWLLQQRQIQINHATMSWQDDLRHAPTLVAREVNVNLYNQGDKHQFRITAIPPALVAHPLDIRGAFRGRTTSQPASWHGTLSIKAERTDLAQWLPWITLPFGINRGFGNVDVQVQIDQKQIIAVSANTVLHQLSLQFAATLPRLNLIDLSGKMQWKRLGSAQSVDLRQLSLRTSDFFYVSPFDFYLRMAPARAKTVANGTIKTNNLWLQSITRLAAYIPLTDAQRSALAQYRPSGRLQQFSANWQGEPVQPLDYQIRGQFYQLGMAANAAIPGFSGLSGQIDTTTAGGNLTLDSRRVQLDLPSLLFEPKVTLDTLIAQLKWQKQADNNYRFHLAHASFSNMDMTGNVFGEYLLQPGHLGVIDLNGAVSRGNGKAAYHYMPLAAKQHAYDWMRINVLDGKISNAKFHLKGDLAKFPFHNDKNGYLDAILQVKEGVMQPAPGFPPIEHIHADIRFTGTRMDIKGERAKLYDADLRRMHAVIPDLFAHEEMLIVNGESVGKLADFLHYANSSPIAGHLDNLTVGATASGIANMSLGFIFPLRHINDTTLAGTIVFNNITIVPAKPLPQLNQVRGKLSFTNKSINAQGITLGLLGGPATLSTASLTNGITRINLQGRATAAGLSPYLDANFAHLISGATNWRGTIDLLRGHAQATNFESDLLGMEIKLPAPFNKAANMRQVVHLNTRPRNENETLIDVGFGQIATAKILQVDQANKTAIERGAIRFGGQAELPGEPGLWITGNLNASTLEGWIGQMGSKPGQSALPLAGLNVTVNQLDIFGRQFNNVAIQAKNMSANWRINVQSPAMQGDINWRPSGSKAPYNTLNARFKTLTIPSSTESNVVNSSASNNVQWPNLSLNVDELQLGNRRLGKLEVSATPITGGLNFERIQLTHNDSKLHMSAYWRPLAIPQTEAKIHFEVSDVGQFLNRFDHPDTVKRGHAVIDGQASWNGTPVDMTVASLSGNFALKANNGQFLKADPGVAKLLGVLSLQSLPRRIGLDFRDVFSNGFAFDDISATIKLDRGVIYSNDFQMQGPAASVQMSGVVNINTQTQQLRAAITPKLSESVALASSLVGGPILGLGVYAVQKLLKDPFGQAVRFDYMITGPWSDPVVSKASRINE